MTLIENSQRRKKYCELEKIITENKNKLFKELYYEQKEYYSIILATVDLCHILIEQHYEESVLLSCKMMEKLML